MQRSLFPSEVGHNISSFTSNCAF